ncbi:hypothetical protein [Streptomyces sp. NPDC059009]|uniref:InlB B-repeat-containing protein n=1 Tax=Streptomyces sp. NPDC059009 TaxID=3346694 RepID=UPI0036ABB624
MTRHALALGVSPGDGGTLAPSLWGPYRPGTEVTVTAWPKPGYTFERWVLDGKESSWPHAPERTVTMDKARTLTAKFIKADCRTTPQGSLGARWQQLGGDRGRLKCALGDAGKTVKGGLY